MLLHTHTHYFACRLQVGRRMVQRVKLGRWGRAGSRRRWSCWTREPRCSRSPATPWLTPVQSTWSLHKLKVILQAISPSLLIIVWSARCSDSWVWIVQRDTLIAQVCSCAVQHLSPLIVRKLGRGTPLTYHKRWSRISWDTFVWVPWCASLATQRSAVSPQSLCLLDMARYAANIISHFFEHWFEIIIKILLIL